MDVVADFANVFYAIVARSVDLDDVDIFPARDALADIALIAGIGRRPFDAIERLGQDARRGGFTDAAGPGE